MIRSSKRSAFFTLALLLIAGCGVWLAVARFSKPSERERAERAIASRDFKAAREHLKLCPDEPEIVLLAARTARRDGDLGEASRLLDKYEAVAGRTDSLQLERKLIQIQDGNGLLGAELLAACRTAPDSEQSKLCLEAILETTLGILSPAYLVHVPIPDQKVERTALPDARTAIAIWFEGTHTPADRVQGHIWRARIRELTGDHAGALADLRAALALEPEHPYANFFLAMCRSQEAPEESLTVLAALTAKRPEESGILQAYVDLLRSSGRMDEAKAILDRLLKKEPDNTRALVQRASISLDLQLPAAAEPMLRKAITLAPEDSDVLAALIRCMRQLGRTEEAAHYQERFLQLERERPPK